MPRIINRPSASAGDQFNCIILMENMLSNVSWANCAFHNYCRWSPSQIHCNFPAFLECLLFFRYCLWRMVHQFIGRGSFVRWHGRNIAFFCSIHIFYQFKYSAYPSFLPVVRRDIAVKTPHERSAEKPKNRLLHRPNVFFFVCFGCD